MVRFSSVVCVVVFLISGAACGKATYEHATVPGASTTTATAPYNGRLHVPVVPESYAEDSDCLCSWRMDPAPPGQQSTLTVDQVRASFETSGFGRDQHPRYYFGLFSGNEPNPNAPDGRLTGVHRVDGVAAWLVIVDDQTFMPSGGASLPGQPRPTVVPVHGWAWTQLRDAPGASAIGGYEETGGEPPLVY